MTFFEHTLKHKHTQNIVITAPLTHGRQSSASNSTVSLLNSVSNFWIVFTSAVCLSSLQRACVCLCGNSAAPLLPGGWGLGQGWLLRLLEASCSSFCSASSVGRFCSSTKSVTGFTPVCRGGAGSRLPRITSDQLLEGQACLF